MTKARDSESGVSGATEVQDVKNLGLGRAVIKNARLTC